MKIIDRIVTQMPFLLPLRREVSNLVMSALWLPTRKAYRTLHFDIVGFCNATCPYCTTGMRTNVSPPPKAVDVRQFRDTIALLLQHGLIARRTIVYLYNWGEPILHPKLNELLHVLRNHKIRFVLSTNGSKFVSLDRNAVRQLSYMQFSMPGFSQHSYDRVHNLDFQKVVANIERFHEDLRAKYSSTSLAIAYHVYRFNTHEIAAAKEFCRSHDIAFILYDGYLNDFNLMQSYLNRTMPTGLLQRVEAALFLDYVNDSISSMPLRYRCPQFDGLAIDENCNVLTCCVLPKGHPNYSLGSIFDTSAATIRKMKISQKVCLECTRLGISWWAHNPRMVRPSEFMHPNLAGSRMIEKAKKITNCAEWTRWPQQNAQRGRPLKLIWIDDKTTSPVVDRASDKIS